MMRTQPDFKAKLQYFTSEHGGRKTPAGSGIFQLVKFDFTETLIGGQQKFLDKGTVNPGESVLAEITLVVPEICKNCLKVGTKFEFGEGFKVTGTGEILEVLNKDLESK